MLKLLAGAACALVLVPPASAAVVTLQAVGVAAYGLDQTGVFGTGGDLTGLPAVLSIRYDTALAPGGAGGVFASEAPDWLTVELSVGGVPFAFARGSGPGYAAMVELVEAGAADQFNLVFQAAGPVVDADVAQSLAITLTGNFFSSTAALPLLDGPLAAAGFAGFSIDDLACDGACVSLKRADGGIELAGLTASSPDATPVPEPSSWAMMILGFGAAGALVRRRRRRPEGRASGSLFAAPARIR